MKYTNKYYLKTTLDKSQKYYADGKYNFSFEIKASPEITMPHNKIFLYTITDDRNTVLNYIDLLADFNPETRIAKVSEKIRIPKLKDDESELEKVLHFNVLTSENNESLLLMPESLSIENPTDFITVYRNNYDLIYLSESLNIQSQKLESGREFYLEANTITYATNFGPTAIIYTAVACLMNENGELTKVGSALSVAQLNESNCNVITCNIPEKLPVGKYQLFVQATDMLMPNGPERSKILGLYEGVIDTLQIEIR